MDIKGRIGKLETALQAKQKFFLWLKNAKAVGGFVSYWEQELRGPLIPFQWFEDREAYFLWNLVNDLNFMVLSHADTNRDLYLFALCALHGEFARVSRHKRDETDVRIGEHLYAKFKTLVEDSFSLGASIAVLSQTYLGGEDVLFADMRAQLDSQISNLREAAEVFAPLASCINVSPVNVESFGPGNPMVDAKTAELENCSRGHAIVGRSTRQELNDALLRICPELSIR